ncbi:hypothetical protein J4464_06555 [Candidatus Woesearchaeota archaeon]|nr:hypothetical protein [Candidatus Woesearchaeota archaeon]
MKMIGGVLLLALGMALFSGVALAEDTDDITVFNFELEKLLNLGSGVLATILFVLTLSAYQRTHRERLLYVSIAFALFAIKGYLTAEELFFGDWAWVDPVASILNIAILVIFFMGMLKK